ncbi:MAG: ATP-binding protein [Candidatus Korobacteraceae bacterium]
MPKTSIQRRLIAAVVISQLVLAAGLVGVAVYFTHRQLRSAFDTELQGRAMSIAALVRYSEDPHPKLIFENELVPPPLERQHPDLYQVMTGDGRLIARSQNWPSELQTTQENPHSDIVVEGIPYRALRLAHVPVLDQEGDAPSTDVLTVTYAAPTDQMNRAVALAGISIALGSTVLVLLTVALAVWGLRRGLRPLEELAASAAAVSTSNWQLNPSEDARDTAELAPLTNAMTAMLEGLQRAFTQQREFLANAAHELKTPVAILKSTLQSLLQRPRAAEEYRAGLEQALDDMARLEKLLHSMLRLARAEQWSAGNARRDLETIDITTSCESAVERLRAVARESNVKLTFTGNGAVLMRADPEDLELVWSNLLENAIRFSPCGETVELRLRADGSRGQIEVQDNGPGIPEPELAHVFERFHRGDSSRSRDSGGYGLGLAISNALIQAYGGSITPESTPGRGTRMVVSLPLVERQRP